MLKYSIIIALTCLVKAVYSVPAEFSKMTDDKLFGIIPVAQGKAMYAETVDCAGVAMADLFRRARLFVAQSATDHTAYLADKETGDLVSNEKLTITVPRSEISVGGVYSFRYTLTIECANRKYRASISNIRIQEGAEKLISIEAFSLKSEADNQVLFAALDTKLKSILKDIQVNVRDYKSF
jgi:hypothetical protein